MLVFTVSEPSSHGDAIAAQHRIVAHRHGTLTGLEYTAPDTITPGRKHNPGGRELLLCEGYLTKLRGTMQNRNRWFVLTTERISFYASNAGVCRCK